MTVCYMIIIFGAELDVECKGLSTDVELGVDSAHVKIDALCT